MTRVGGCRCGGVRYAVEGPVRDVLVCHCTDCVAASGRPWAATAAHRRDLALLVDDGLDWRLAPGSDHGASRGRCDRCGTVVFWDAPARDTVSIDVDTLDDSTGLAVVGHIWLAHDPGWEPSDAAQEPRLPGYPRGFPQAGGPPLRWVD